jgi:DNA-binding GntR family transcriptional regulator
MATLQSVPRRATPRSADRLDRDRQAAPQVFERLRGMIISLELPPGSPLSRAALATQFGVSSTPIRDALMRLEEEGLVDVFPQHATVVSQVDVRLAQQAHFLRQAVELEIVRVLALRHGHEAVAAELNATIARQQHYAKAGDFERFMAADNEFHSQLYAAADKQDIWSLVRSRSGHIDRLRRLHLPSPGKAQDILRHHKLIAKAIGAGKPDEAQKHLRTHLSGTLGEIARIRARYPEYLSN